MGESLQHELFELMYIKEGCFWDSALPTICLVLVIRVGVLKHGNFALAALAPSRHLASLPSETEVCSQRELYLDFSMYQLASLELINVIRECTVRVSL